MGVSVTGNSQLERELMRRLGSQRTQQIVDRALLAGANVFVRELKQQFETFKDTGESIEEITISQPMTVGGARTVKIHWKGPKGRYRIIHLNEWGTVKNPNPRGKGAIARAMRNAENAYRETVKRELRRGL
ncbi:hypothetical protein NDK25_22035 [Niallia taxi]|nr:hypothetical protein [Niallia taxi]MDE5054898.1 hypothetical protein [Niallia taxi]